MRLSTRFTLFALCISSIRAKPVPNDQSLFLRGQNVSLEVRQCAGTPCGWNNAYCCTGGEVCFTSNNIASCTADSGQAIQTGGGGEGGNYQLFTTTYTETDLRTITTTWSVLQTPGGSPGVGGSPGPAEPTGLVCGAGQDPCGAWLCCASYQMCASPGQCVNRDSAAIRPTSNTIQTVTSTASATTTQGFQTPVTGDGSNISAEASQGGLSGGAIAGIVIGVLAGLVILFFILACLCCKGLIDGILAIFGCGRRKRTEETYIETHHSHHGSHAPPRRRWFGMAGPSRPEPKKKEGMGFLGVAGLLTGLAVLLGLKRRHDRREEKSSYTGSVTSYSYTDYTETSASSASSDRRTRNTRHSRHSRHSRR